MGLVHTAIGAGCLALGGAAIWALFFVLEHMGAALGPRMGGCIRALAAEMHFRNRGEIEKGRAGGRRVEMEWRRRRWGMCADVKG